jgi:hypothetical protein
MRLDFALIASGASGLTHRASSIACFLRSVVRIARTARILMTRSAALVMVSPTMELFHSAPRHMVVLFCRKLDAAPPEKY